MSLAGNCENPPALAQVALSSAHPLPPKMSFLEEGFCGSPQFTRWQQPQDEQSLAVGWEEAGAAPTRGFGQGCSSIPRSIWWVLGARI